MKCPRDNAELDLVLEQMELQKFVCPECYMIITCEESDDEDVRKCDQCQKPMKQGYCISGGENHYCSKECLHKVMTDKEFEELYADGNGDSYWTEYTSYLISES